MIAAVRGNVADRHDDQVVVATAGGVSYAIAVPTHTWARLPAVGAEVFLHTVLVVREDDWSLYGFDAPRERQIFQRLLAASGVGPRLALSLVSALGADRVVRAIRDNDLAALCTVSGVGKKKAERMVLELKDRMRDLEDTDGSAPTPAGATPAIGALTTLGYAPLEAETAVRSVLADDGAAETSDVIRRALERLQRGL